MKTTWKTLLTVTAVAMTLGTAQSAFAANTDTANTINMNKAQLASLDHAFNAAAQEFSVPKELLMAIAYSESRWQQTGDVSTDNGYGLMHLTQNQSVNTLSQAAQALGISESVLKSDAAQNIRGGAYLLAQYQKSLNKSTAATLNDWYEAVALYEHAASDYSAKTYADEVYRLIQVGAGMHTQDGGALDISAHTSLSPKKGKYTDVMQPMSTPDYSGAIWNPAYSGNYQAATRPSSNPINYIIIHDTEGSYSGTISWFQDPSAQVSAHYVVRSSDGQITQMVQEKDIAWHARSFNSTSVGIEHEGYESQTGWYTDAMYRSSAALAKNIASRYGIPMNRDHILGHSELYGNDHTDPGANWNWNTYMTYMTGISKNWNVVQVDNSNFNTQNSGFSQGGPSQYWHPTTGYGIHNEITYTMGNGNNPISNYGIWTPNIPVTGNYEVKVFIPSNYATTTNAKYEIHYNGGIVTKAVNQDLYSNAWVSLGTYSFAAGKTGYVKLGDNTGDTAYVAMDAMKFMGQ